MTLDIVPPAIALVHAGVCALASSLAWTNLTRHGVRVVQVYWSEWMECDVRSWGCSGWAPRVGVCPRVIWGDSLKSQKGGGSPFRYLGPTSDQLDTIAHALSDNQSAHQLNQGRATPFQSLPTLSALMSLSWLHTHLTFITICI